MSNLQYDTGCGEEKNWLIEETVFDAARVGKCEAIFCQGNGYLGQRAALEERYVGETRNLFVTGVFDRFSPGEVTELANLPDMTALKLTLAGENFSMETGKLHAYSRVFNLKNGLLSRNVLWESPKGARYQLCFERFVSMADEHIMGSRFTVKPLDAPAHIIVESGMDARVTNSGTQHFLEGEKRLYDGEILETRSITGQSGVHCCQHEIFRFMMDGQAMEKQARPIIDRRYLGIRLSVDVGKDSAFTMDRIACVHTSRDLAYMKLGEEEAAKKAAEDGRALLKKGESYDALKNASAETWTALWQKMDIQIESKNDIHPLALRFALYHLNIMVKKDDSRVGIAAKGLTGEGYKGHSFWDTEIFILPYFLLTQPDVARTLLEYRWQGLKGARGKAKENGYAGAMYPWETAWTDDGEVTPLWGGADVVTGEATKILSGAIEHHISADIAYAVWQYYTVTGDEDFLRRFGYEIIIDTAIFWASRCAWNEEKQRFEIGDVIGPDEYKEHVDNNAYTNYMAAYNMRLALDVMDRLKADNSTDYQRLDARFDFDRCQKDIEKVLDKLYLPKAGEDGIIPQFEGYFDLKPIDLAPYKAASVVGTIYNDYNIEQISKLQVAKQTDLLMLFFLLEDLFDADIKRKNYMYYEPRTLHDSSLSKNAHCVLACDLGLDKQAEEFFEGSYNVDMGPIMTTSDMGIHSAAMGGIWQCAVYGFGGVRVVDGRLRIQPALHSEWERLSFPLIWRGNPLWITITPMEIQIENRGKADIEIELCGKNVLVKADETHEQHI